MTIYYVDSAATGTNAGTSWTNAWTSIASAFSNVTTAGDVVYVSHTHSESLSATTTYTVTSNHTKTAPLKVYSVNKGTGVYTPGALIGAQSTSQSITINGSNTGLSVYGLTFRIPGTTNVSMTFGSSAGCFYTFVDCGFLLLTTSTSPSIFFANVGANSGAKVDLENCEFQFGSTSQEIILRGALFRFADCTAENSSAAPTTIINATTGSNAQFIGCDLSNSGTLINSDHISSFVEFIHCKIPSTFSAGGAGTARLFDCHSGDTHLQFAQSNEFAELSLDSSIYANDNISGNRSWKITTTSDASRYNPFVTPWISVYHDGTSAITPYLEILRSGSSTAFTNAEVWAEWSYKGTSGSTRATIANDGALPLATPANQTASSLGAAGWTGENATSWFGKIGPASAVTPAEVGDLAFRICVGAPSTTVYVCPSIRGLS